MKRYIRTLNGKIYDLKSEFVSSYELNQEITNEGDWLDIYYYNRDRGEHLEIDGKGGTSMSSILISDIIGESDDILDLIRIGDLVELNKNHITVMEDYMLGELQAIKEHCTKFYTKQWRNYILVWDKGLGLYE